MKQQDSERFRPQVIYASAAKKQQLVGNIKVIAFYVFIFTAWMVLAHFTERLGAQWVIPSISLMWIIGAITAFLIPNDREETIAQTKWGILGYIGFLFIYRAAAQLIAPLTPDQMASSLGLNVPAASGATATGFLTTMLVIISVTVPIGFAVWCGQKFMHYKGSLNKHESFRRIKGIRDNARRF